MSNKMQLIFAVIMSFLFTALLLFIAVNIIISPETWSNRVNRFFSSLPGNIKDVILFFCLILFIPLAFVLFYGTYTILSAEKTSYILSHNAKNNSLWDKTFIKESVQTMFTHYQEALLKQDIEITRDFITDELYRNNKISFGEDEPAKSDARIESVIVIHAAKDNPAETRKIIVIIEGTSRLLAPDNNENTNKDSKPFIEIWSLEADESKWVLDGISRTIKTSYLMKKDYLKPR